MMDCSSVKVLLYNDAGTSNVEVLRLALQAAFDSIKKKTGCLRFQISMVSASAVNEGSCFKDADIIFVPGGRDLPYVEKLKGSGVENIRNFVENGGKYFGICAGAYFASSFCEFQKGSGMEVCGKRELKLYPGVARGCLYPGFQYGTENGATIIDINLLKTNIGLSTKSENYPVYYNGGCEFILDCKLDAQNLVYLAKYEDFPSKNAIVLCKCGKGKVVLSGVHPELNYKFIQDKSVYSKEQLQRLYDISDKQQELFELLIECILA